MGLICVNWGQIEATSDLNKKGELQDDHQGSKLIPRSKIAKT